MNMRMKSDERNLIIRQVLLSCFLLLALLPFLSAQEAAAYGHFRIDGGFNSASGQSVSASFRLTACLGDAIAGLATSRSFCMLSGSAAFCFDLGARQFMVSTASTPEPGPFPAVSRPGPWTGVVAVSPAPATMTHLREGTKAGKK